MVIDAPWCSNPRFPSSVPAQPTFCCPPNPSCAPAFGCAPASTPDFKNQFGISSLPDTERKPAIRFFVDTHRKPGTGSRLTPYSPTREQEEVEKIYRSISAMPAYNTKSQEELRWEDYEELSNKECCGSKNCDTLLSQIDTLHSQFETLRSQFQTLCSQFEMSNLFGPKNNSAVSPFHQTQEPKKNLFGPSFPTLSPFSQPQALNTTNNNPFRPNSTPFPPPSQYSPFGPNSTFFPTPSLFSQPQALKTTDELFKPNNNPFGTTNDNTSPTPNIFALNKHHQMQPFGLLERRLEPNEVYHSISAMPGYEAKSHEELRWENYKSLPNNKCCGFKNYATIRSPWSLSPNDNLFGPPSNSTTSATSSTICPGESPFFQNPTQTTFDTTFQMDKPNNNSFGPTNNNSSPVQSFIPPSPYKPNKTFMFTPSKNDSTTIFPSPQFSPFSFDGPTTTFFQFPPASQPAGNTGFRFFTDSFNQPSQESSSSKTKATEVGYQNINGQQHQYVPARTVGTQSPIGLSSSPSKEQNKLTSNTRIAPPQQSPRSEPKVTLSRDEEDRSGPSVPRENADAWVANSLPSLHSSSDGKVCEDKDLPTSLSFQLNIQEAEHLSVTSDSHEADVLSLLPKLPDGGRYYTVPSLNELAAKETAEPGSLSRVKEFVVGRFGNGSIKFLGETDVRDLDLGSILEINYGKVIVYPDAKMKPAVGKGMNKAAEVSLLNLKCVSKKTGKQYVDGPQVQSYKEMLIKKGSELGAEFVSYEPVHGEWKFRVQHF